MLSDKKIMLKLISLIHDCDEKKAETLLWNEEEQQGGPYFDVYCNFTPVGKRSFQMFNDLITQIKSMATHYETYVKQFNA
jgi:hypothetical protein